MAEVSVSVHSVPSRTLAVIRRRVALGGIAAVCRPALDLVWAFLRGQPGLRTDGHNVFLYHHPRRGEADMEIDFGVEVTRPFEPVGEIHATETPAGQVAVAVHVGPYHLLAKTHGAIQAWCAAHGRPLGGKSWEIYGDWTEDPSKLETTCVYLLA